MGGYFFRVDGTVIPNAPCQHQSSAVSTQEAPHREDGCVVLGVINSKGKDHAL